ncbi:MAG: hypothetical protein IJW52_01995 [Clostridia bacterium]|nr:hypothetical protein [Clostridia bacterium]
MKRRFLRAAALLLCLVILVSCFASCEKDAPEETVGTGELANPFDAVYPFDSISITELVKDPEGNYVKNKIKNAYDGELFVSMLRECKFFDDSTNIDSVELSYLIEIDGLSFFVSTDLSHIYVSRSKENKLMQRDVIAYRVEGFGGMEWELLLQLRQASSGLYKELQGVICINELDSMLGMLKGGVVKNTSDVKHFYNMIKNCTLTEASAQLESTYKYYCTVGGMSFLLSEDIGGFRYMSEAQLHENPMSSPYFVLKNTYRLEGFDNDYFNSLVKKRETSFFNSLLYVNAKNFTEGNSSFLQLTRMSHLHAEDIYKIRYYLSLCEFELTGKYQKGDMLPNGSYFGIENLDYEFYISPACDKLIVLPKPSATEKEAFVYSIRGLPSGSFNQMISTFLVDNFENSTVQFWEIDEDNFK